MTVKSTRKNRDAYFICPSCGLIGHGKNIMPGNRFTELFLWIVFLFPGPIYSAWRHFNQKLVCFKCGNPEIIPVNSPEGDRLFNQQMRAE